VEELEKKIKSAKAKYSKKKNDTIDSSAGLTLVIELVSGVAVGTFFGYILDSHFGTFPVFLLSLMILGTIGGFYNFYKYVSRRLK
jgi:F0F1-type ATP synthase assembly protein I